MNRLIIYAHPRKKSFNHAILETVERCFREEGDAVIVRDLYEMGFQPVLGTSELLGGVGEDVVREQSYLTWADHVVMIYPLWWTGMPAILKGYVERVFSYGFAYKYEKGLPVGLLKGKQATVIHTQNKSRGHYEANGTADALRLTIDEGILAYCGFEVSSHLVYDLVLSSTEDDRSAWLERLPERLRKHGHAH